ncbi:hypothetical protein C8F04DRAFT_307682 [Mycena alexandri]|uniref:Uncharacterized protein n=1 Tax=Mycena alexandri TaxID=1745969 RepID=A0AAD6S456_9AGAR|nr:hypothetical protein C8F04DRAFT_307682 [Mycena alexandri]
MASREDRTPSTLTRKRPRVPLIAQLPAPRLHSPHEAELARFQGENPYSELRDEAGASGVDITSVAVAERSRKRRKIHVITVFVPEREIKQEETPPISLSDSILHCRSSSPSRGFPLVGGNGRISSTSPPPSVEGAQQPTPPASQRADTVDPEFESSIETSSPSVAPDQQPTPPATPSSATTDTGFEMSFLAALPPPPTLSWPAKVVDYETYELAAASTQALMDHYLDAVKFTLEGNRIKLFSVGELGVTFDSG